MGIGSGSVAEEIFEGGNEVKKVGNAREREEKLLG